MLLKRARYEPLPPWFGEVMNNRSLGPSLDSLAARVVLAALKVKVESGPAGA